MFFDIKPRLPAGGPARTKPTWPDLFIKETKRLLKKAREQKRFCNDKNDSFWYNYNSDTLAELMATGRGNCVAWSELTVELAKECGLKVKRVIIGDRLDKEGKKNPHQVTLVYEKNGTIWYQSCISTERLYKPRGKEDFFKTKKRLCRTGARDCGWKSGAIVLRVF